MTRDPVLLRLIPALLLAAASLAWLATGPSETASIALVVGCVAASAGVVWWGA